MDEFSSSKKSVYLPVKTFVFNQCKYSSTTDKINASKTATVKMVNKSNPLILMLQKRPTSTYIGHYLPCTVYRSFVHSFAVHSSVQLIHGILVRLFVDIFYCIALQLKSNLNCSIWRLLCLL